MLKPVGLLFLFLGCLSCGLTRSLNLRKRLELLNEFRRVLILLSGEIRYIHSPIPEAFSRVGKKVAEPYRSFLLAVAARLEGEDKRPLGEVFEENRGFFDGTALTKEDRERILELGRQIGYLDLTMQLKTLELCRETLEDAIKKAAADYGEKAKMYRYLGVLAGLFLVVLLV